MESETPAQASPSVNGTSPRRAARIRSRVACQACNRRKIRCDVTQTGGPCSNCQYDSALCEVLPRKKHRPRRSRPKDVGKSVPSDNPNSHDQYEITPEEQFMLPDDSPSSYIGDKRGPRYSVYDLCHPGTPQEARTVLGEQSSSNHNRKPHELEFLGSEGAFETLPRAVSNEIIRCYFHHVHFYLPVINASKFLKEYNDNGCQNINPLLLWSMFLAAANFLEESTLQAAGFPSRKAMKTAMYTRAKCLYDLDRGTDKITLIQSVLLASFWYTDPQDHTGAWYWVGIAISLAQSIGIHRDPSSINIVIPMELQPLTRRIWWACVVRDRWVSLAKGRPMRIHDEDCDVPMTCSQDISNEINDIAPDIRDYFLPAHYDALPDMWVSLVGVSAMLGRIMRVHYRVKGPKPSIEEVEKLSTELQAHRQSEFQPDCTDELILVHKYHLELFYQATVVVLYRPYLLNLDADLPIEGNTSWQKTAQSRARSAASATNMALDKFMNLDVLGFVKPMIITALIPTMQVHLFDCRSSNLLPRNLAMNRLDLCMLFLANVCNTYWSAGVMYRLFERARNILSGIEKKKRDTPMHIRSDSTNQEANNLNSFDRAAEPLDPSNLLGSNSTAASKGTGTLWPNNADGNANSESTYLTSIDQLLNPDFALPDDDATALFPYFNFGTMDQNLSHARIATDINIDLFRSD